LSLHQKDDILLRQLLEQDSPSDIGLRNILSVNSINHF
jgi:hypothetical protein